MRVEFQECRYSSWKGVEGNESNDVVAVGAARAHVGTKQSNSCPAFRTSGSAREERVERATLPCKTCVISRGIQSFPSTSLHPPVRPTASQYKQRKGASLLLSPLAHIYTHSYREG